jgi:serine/threonine protein kinase
MYRNNIVSENNLINYDKCIDLIHNNIKSFNIIGSGNESDVYKIYSNKCGSVVLKKYKILDKTHNKFINEVKILKLLSDKLLLCPHFIQYIDSNEKDYYIILEYADGDSTFIFNNINYPLYYSYLCQILIGLIYLDKLKIYHCDLKPENILHKKINKNIVFHYVINNIDFYVPSYGYLFMLADFSLANIFNHEKLHYFLKNIKVKPHDKYNKLENIFSYNKLSLFDKLNKYFDNYKKNIYNSDYDIVTFIL